MTSVIPDWSDIEAADRRIGHFINRTPVITSRYFDDLVDAKVFFKCENLQKVGAFKFRGACNAVFSLSDEEAKKGVATHSSGNHAQALSLAARLRGIDAHIVMPKTSPEVKVNAVRDYGGKIIFCEPTLESRECVSNEVVEKTGARFIHPFNDAVVIAGQATAAKEFIEETGSLDVIIAPVGGGGLLSGTCLSVKRLSPSTKVFGAEPEGADDAYRSLRDGRIHPSVNPKTVADGLLTSLGDLTFDILRANVSGILRVSDDATIRAMRDVFERMKMVVEPSAAVPIGALLEGQTDVKGKRVGIIISGGNVDLDRLPWTKDA